MYANLPNLTPKDLSPSLSGAPHASKAITAPSVGTHILMIASIPKNFSGMTPTIKGVSRRYATPKAMTRYTARALSGSS